MLSALITSLSSSSANLRKASNDLNTTKFYFHWSAWLKYRPRYKNILEGRTVDSHRSTVLYISCHLEIYGNETFCWHFLIDRWIKPPLCLLRFSFFVIVEMYSRIMGQYSIELNSIYVYACITFLLTERRIPDRLRSCIFHKSTFLWRRRGYLIWIISK